MPNAQCEKLHRKPPPHIKIGIDTADRMHALAAGLLCKKKQETKQNLKSPPGPAPNLKHFFQLPTSLFSKQKEA